MKQLIGIYTRTIGFAALATLLVACGGAQQSVGYNVSGTVTAGSEPVRTVRVIGQHEGGIAEALSRHDGTWELTGLQGKANITTADPAYMSADQVTVTSETSGVTLSITLKQCNSGSMIDEGDPCVLTRIQQVQAITNHLDGFFQLGSDIDASETAGWGASEGFQPIGTYPDGPFIGLFDGAGFSIAGLVITRPSEDHIGLFAYVSDTSGRDIWPSDSGYQAATIQRVVLRNPVITGGEYVGALAGEVHQGAHIHNVSVSAGTIVGTRKVGGLIGEATNEEITHASSNADTIGERDIGGLIGSWDGTILTESFSTGSVKGDTNVGGLIGHAEAAITGSYSLAAITVQQGSAGPAGGLVGRLEGGHAGTSYSASTIHADALATVGGLIGKDGSGATFADSFWDNDLSEVPGPGMGIPKTTNDMFKQATYAGWDFANTWEITEGEDYPDLQRNPR